MSNAEDGETTELQRLAAVLPSLIRGGLATVEAGGSVRLVVTATRTDEPNPQVRVSVALSRCLSSEYESVLAEVLRLKGVRATRTDPAGQDRTFLEDVVREIVSHLDDEAFDVARLGHALHTSPSQLRRELRSTIDRSPAELIRIVRLLRARELMADPDCSLSSIAHACGFSDQAHFSRTFRRYFGSSPSSCRRTTGGLASGSNEPGGFLSPPADGGSRPRSAGRHPVARSDR
ncbi:MAG: helix-turn-helix transcriptional regulator [Longimicrobiales bacterium]|nr:helix-turn-helix transcriptional regulator [Longimicrobiales bacterium]